MRPIDPDTALPLSAPPEDDIDIDIEPASPNDDTPDTRLAAPLTVDAAPNLDAPTSGETLAVSMTAEEPSDGPRNAAERTGRTGIFFTPSHLADGVLDDLPPFDMPPTQDSGWHYVTGRPRNRMRHFVLTRLTPVLLLSGVILWSYMQLSGGRPPIRLHDPQVPLATTGESDDLPHTPMDLPDPAPEPDLDPAPANLRLATADVIEVLADGSAAPRRMNKIFARDRVTILNLWATFCGPCKEELPAFRELFDQQRDPWHGEVEFIPVQIDDAVDGVTARREHTAQMPAFEHFLSDRGLPTGIKAALVTATDAPKPWSLPVTIVVRCDGTIEKLFATSFKTVEDLRPVVVAVNSARSTLASCRVKPPPKPELADDGEQPDQLLTPPPCGKIICARDEVCETKHPPTFKPACVPGPGTVQWEAP